MKETIITFDNEIWDRKAIIEKMYDDSFYYGYLGQNALSSSTIKTLLSSPKTYHFTKKYGSGETQALRDGKLFHTMILEPEKLNDIIFVDAATKASKEYKLAKETGKEVYTKSEKKAAERLCDALLRNEAVKEYLTKAEYEVPQIAMINNLPIRAKADILKGNTIIDLKTTTGIKDFRYSADKYSYDLQAWLYREMFGVDNFVFIAIDKGSLDIAIFECSDEFYAKGKEKFEQGISNFKYFFQTEGVDLDQYVLRGVL